MSDKSVDESLDSVYELASNKQKSLLEFISEDPEYAVRCAEMSHAKWTNVLTQVAVSKNQIKALELRTKQSKEEMCKVVDYAMTITPDNKKRDHLIRTLYMNAVLHHDTRALTYLVDRLDGRPAESRVADLEYDNAYNIYMILHTLFDKQLSVLNAGNGTLLVCCSRRAGKTHLLVALCLIECLRRPNTMELTEGLIDKAANEIIDQCHLQDKRGKRLNWKKFDNNSMILVRGLSNTKDPAQIRGNKAKVIVIDEFFHLKSELLRYLQDEVLQPMQMDYADDYKFICAGSPPSIKGTYGEMAWRNWEVPHFTWTWRENPHPVDLETREAYIEKSIEEKGLSWDTPFVRREYNGEWVYDDDLLLYPNYKVYDPSEGIPQWSISRVLFGVDYGVSDNDAIIGIAWSDDEGKGYEFFESKFNRLDIKDRTISQLEYLKQQVMNGWSTALEFFNVTDPESAKQANKRILWDADDNDQHLTEELGIDCRFVDDSNLEKLTLQIANAHKTDKKIMWDKIDELMRTGRLLILRRDESGAIFNEIDDRAFHPDLLPAMRYALWNVLK